MNCEKLSPRQLWVAVLTGGMSTGAAAAGRADWRWLLLAVALGTGAGWLLLWRAGSQKRPLNPILKIMYCAWAVVLASDVLLRAAQRIQQAAGSRENTGWLLVLLAAPLLWMGWGKAAAFFRAVEIFWLGLLAALAAILLLGVPRVDWQWALRPGGDWKDSLLAGGLIMSTGLFVLPHLYKIESGPEDVRWGLAWLGALGALSAALAALTAGLLSPSVAAQLDGPFFAAAGLLGDSARLEGLVSAMWLLPDLTLAGLLVHSWGRQRWPALGAAAALGLALAGVTELLPEAVLPLGCIVLAVLTVVFPFGYDK